MRTLRGQAVGFLAFALLAISSAHEGHSEGVAPEAGNMSSRNSWILGFLTTRHGRS
jgi:hypothetical protein